MWRLLSILVLLGVGSGAAVGAGCGDPGPDRLIPPGDPDYVELERPEEADECGRDTDCEVTCVHACAAIDPGPVTCPSMPPPRPARLDGAACVCLDQLCAWN